MLTVTTITRWRGVMVILLPVSVVMSRKVAVRLSSRWSHPRNGSSSVLADFSRSPGFSSETETVSPVERLTRDEEEKQTRESRLG